MNNFDLIQSITYVAVQYSSSEALTSCHLKKDKGMYIVADDRKAPASLDDIGALTAEVIRSNFNHTEKRAAYIALQCILDHFNGRSKFRSFFQTKPVFNPFNYKKKRREEEKIHGICQKINQFCAAKSPNHHVQSEAEARCRFSREFKSQFQCIPRGLLKREAILLDMISKRIWSSKNVQQKASNEKYGEYKKLMTEFYVGSHMLFEEKENESVLKQLERSIREGIENRVSSHYGKVGAETHRHIRGKQLPETLFYHGIFNLKGGKKKQVVPGIYAHGQKNSRVFSKSNQFKAFWIQTERTPDGPKFKNWLKHRSVDFLQYFFLKNVLKSKRPQIANYVGPWGRGVPDSNPIIVRLN